MTSRRDFILEQLGITQWQLVKPEVFKGDLVIKLDPTIKFLIITDSGYQEYQKIIKDILWSINLTEKQLTIVNSEQALYLVAEHPIICCQISIDSQFKISHQIELIGTLEISNLFELAHSGKLKKELWLQIKELFENSEISIN